MVKFLNSSGISYHLENLIKNSKDKLFLVSPYLKFNAKIKQLLDDRNRLKIDIRIIYGKVDLQTDESKWLKSMDSIKVLFCNNLHAKCYINEKEAIVTSMNLYDYSQQNNNEMGIYVAKQDDPKVYQDIYEEVYSLIRISEHVTISIEKVEPVKKETKLKISNKEKAYCIRCKARIKFDMKKPFCSKCFKSWSKYSDKKYQEKYCLICGKEHKSSFEKPICYSCFKKNKSKIA
jgi:phosphatidylserine/phosphatidylglycerophosphate/cardiolipin synthase-like enzyme